MKKGKNVKEMVMGKLFILFLSIFLFFPVPVFAADQSSNGPSVMDTLEDVLYIRPLGFVRVIIEAVAFGVSLPVTAPLKQVDEAREFLIEDPYSFTFERPLGEM